MPPRRDQLREVSPRLLVWLGAAVLALCCFKPTVTPGLRCAPAPAMPCPDGYTCAGDLCVQNGGSGATVGSGGAGTGGVTGSGGAGTGGAGTGGAAPPKQSLGQSCGASSECDQTMQLGAMGVTCAPDYSAGPMHCYSVCAADADCPTSFCRPTFVCEVPSVDCDPVQLLRCFGSQHCYLIAGSPNPLNALTVCDLSRDARSVNDSCSDSRLCAAGLVCPPSGAGVGTCQRACNPANGNSDCTTAGSVCHTFGATWGYCL
jgi:hypothetical protein